MDIKTIERDSAGKLPAFAWPGGYPVFYLAADNGILCPKCANNYVEGRDNEKQLKPIAGDVYWEGPTMQCEHCNADIESAYGDPAEGADNA